MDAWRAFGMMPHQVGWRPVAYVYELVVVEGPLQGRSFRVPTHQTLRIGRTSRDLPLFQDEKASFDHAEISWTADGFWVRDLGSEIGTFIDEYPVPEAGQALLVGSRLRVGQTLLRLDERRAIPAWLGWSAAAGLPLVCVLTFLIVLGLRPIEYAPQLRFAEAIGQGAVTSDTAVVPLWFIRKYGVDHRDLRARRVTDFDDDGRSELWISVNGREAVVELDAEAGWELLGELPADCQDEEGLDFPVLSCAGRRYRMVGGQYELRGLERVVVWAQPMAVVPGERDAPPSRVPGPARPYRMSLPQPERLAGFLAARGVDEPIHYLVCEGAFAGVRAQVLTAAGELQTLDTGCFGALSLNGPGMNAEMAPEPPVAVALTAHGFEALRRDANTFVLGDPSAAFSRLVPTALAAFTASPASLAARVEVDAEPVEQLAMAEEAQLVGVRHWDHADTAQPAAALLLASLESAGTARLDVPGCAEIEVVTKSWHCLLRRACTPGAIFLTATEVGCGAPRPLMSMSYGGGLARATLPEVEMLAQIDLHGDGGQIDVNRVRLGFRIPDSAAEATSP